jgi:hypothetical protein
MSRRIATISMFLLLILAAPSVFACKDCSDGVNCLTVATGARFCEFFVGGGCRNHGTCPTLAAVSLQAEYRVAAVRVLEPGKALPAPARQLQPAQVMTASK